MTEKDILKYVREDMVALGEKFDKGFERLDQKIEQKFDDLRAESLADNDKITGNCSQKRYEIYQRIETNRKGIEQLDKKFFRLLLVGTSIGFVSGIIVTVLVTNLSKGLIP